MLDLAPEAFGDLRVPPHNLSAEQAPLVGVLLGILGSWIAVGRHPRRTDPA